MALTLTRRSVIAGAPALLSLGSEPAHAAAANPIAAIEKRHGSRLGVFVLDTGSGQVLAHRADERFLSCSTFKGVLAALVLSRVDAGQDDLASLVLYGRKDLEATRRSRALTSARARCRSRPSARPSFCSATTAPQTCCWRVSAARRR